MNVCTSASLSSLGTSLGLSSITGYSPYMPVLALAIAAKWFHTCDLNASFSFITNDWFILIVVLLTIADLIIDKIWGASVAWHTIHAVISPCIGGFITLATLPGSITIPGIHALVPGSGSALVSAGVNIGMLSQAGGIHLSGPLFSIFVFIIGFLLTGIIYLHRLGGRLVIHFANPVVSLVEDIVAVICILLSFLAPMVMLVIVILIVIVVLSTFGHVIKAITSISRFIRGG